MTIDSDWPPIPPKPVRDIAYWRQLAQDTADELAQVQHERDEAVKLVRVLQLRFATSEHTRQDANNQNIR